MRDDKFKVFHLNIIMKKSDEKVHKNINLGRQNDYVYDIETESHDFNSGFPLIVQKTDSFVLKMNTKKYYQRLEKFRRYILF